MSFSRRRYHRILFFQLRDETSPSKHQEASVPPIKRNTEHAFILILPIWVPASIPSLDLFKGWLLTTLEYDKELRIRISEVSAGLLMAAVKQGQICLVTKVRCLPQHSSMTSLYLYLHISILCHSVNSCLYFTYLQYNSIQRDNISWWVPLPHLGMLLYRTQTHHRFTCSTVLCVHTVL